MPDITGSIVLANRVTNTIVNGAFYLSGSIHGYALAIDTTNMDKIGFSSARSFPRVSNQVVVANIAVGVYMTY